MNQKNLKKILRYPVAIISARGNSKRLKNKNILNIFGKPMIYWTIKAIKKSNGCNKKLFVEDFSLALELAKLGNFCFIDNLTSFGPNSVWDELYFVHFFPNKKYDGSYSIFKIENDLIYNHKVNATQTMRDQQKQDRRPRFSIIKEIIIPNKIKPVIQGSLII